jgi:2-polyprenyl-3-methyl-5-hydroxy-6-metoxy-1,4-benzoquinol methylase
MIEIAISKVTFMEDQFRLTYGTEGYKNRDCPICHSAEASFIVSEVKSSSKTSLVQKFCSTCEMRYHSRMPSSEVVLGAYSTGEWETELRGNGDTILKTTKNFLRTNKYTKNIYRGLKRIVRGDRLNSKELSIWSALYGIVPDSRVADSYGENTAVRNVLDFGCGTGFMMNLMESRGLNVFGVDGSKRRVEWCNKQNLKTFHSSSYAKDLLAFAPFDLIYSQQVFEHLHDPDEELKILTSLLRDGGYLLLEVPNLEYNIFHTAHQHAHCNGFSLRALTVLLNKHGYKPVRVFCDINLTIVAQKTKDALYQESHSMDIKATIDPLKSLSMFSNLSAFVGKPLTFEYTNGVHRISDEGSVIYSCETPYKFAGPNVFGYRLDIRLVRIKSLDFPIVFSYEEDPPTWVE